MPILLPLPLDRNKTLLLLPRQDGRDMRLCRAQQRIRIMPDRDRRRIDRGTRCQTRRRGRRDAVVGGPVDDGRDGRVEGGEADAGY